MEKAIQDQEMRITAKTLELALEQAAKTLGREQEDFEYRIVSQTNGGFFAFLAKKVEIAVKLKKQKNDRSYRSRSHASRAKDTAVTADLSAAEIKELTQDLRQFCAGICNRVSGEELTVEATMLDDRLILDIDDAYLASQISKNPKLAESLEHVLRKKPRHLKRELPFRIFVDVQGIRRKREIELADLAKDLSAKVFENRRPIVLNYKSSYDRKIIHMALDKDERVYTKSIGSGPNRKLMILPVKNTGDSELVHESVEE